MFLFRSRYRRPVSLVPDLPASGGISFANTGTSPVTLPAGTEIVSDGGIVFTLDAEVTVPAASGGVSGNADGLVTAAEGGTAESGARRDRPDVTNQGSFQ
ncbi:MAG: hypothetical protein R2843_05330 [Thermomicrobiales bacterium]